MRRAVVVLALSSAVLSPLLRAQSSVPRNLTGTWTLEDSSGRSVYGQTFTAVQDASTLALDYGTSNLSASSNGTRPTMSVTPGQNRHMLFTLDGLDTAKSPEVPAAPTPEAPASPGVLTWKIVSTVSRASWNGDQLVIVTYNTGRLHLPNRADAVDTRQTVRNVFTPMADDRLSIERLIIADPFPGGTAQRIELSGAVTSVYKRSK